MHKHNTRLVTSSAKSPDSEDISENIAKPPKDTAKSSKDTAKSSKDTAKSSKDTAKTSKNTTKPTNITKSITNTAKTANIVKPSTNTVKISKIVKTPLNLTANLNSSTPGPSRGRGRGRISTPLIQRSSSNISLVSSQTDTSTKAIRSSSVARSLDSYKSEDTVVEKDNSNCELLEKSFPDLDIGSLENLIEPIGFIDNQPNLNIKLAMATGGGNPNGEQAQSTYDALMHHFQETMRRTQEEFRQEFVALRESISQSRETRENGAPLGPVNTQGQTSGLPSNAFSCGPTAVHYTKLKDWKVSFSGEGSVSDFLFKVEVLRRRSQYSSEYIMSNFPIFLTDKADTWYWAYIKRNPEATYEDLKTALNEEFGTLETDSEILLKISTRKQLAKENYDDFHSFIVNLNLRLRSPMDDASLIEIIKKNVNPDLKVMLFISNPRDLAELRLLARKAEKVLLENKSNNNFTRSRQINEISVDTVSDDSDQEVDPQIEAIKINRNFIKGDYSKIKCWNCLQLGHSYIYCEDKTRHVFCYKCGKRDVTTPKCTEPHTENRRRSEWVIGDARSSK